MSIFSNLERVFATLAAMLVFTLNELRMFNFLPRQPDAAHGLTHGIWLRLLGDAELTYVSDWDLGVRWALAGLIVALSMWALAQTLKAAPAK